MSRSFRGGIKNGYFLLSVKNGWGGDPTPTNFAEKIRQTVFAKALYKGSLFTVRLTIRVEPPPPSSVLGDFFVRLPMYYDYMCSETDFTQEKSHFHPNI